MKTPRWMHCIYAHVMGYFWLPCPVCKRYFGGHEKGWYTFNPRTGDAEGLLTCGCNKPKDKS